MALPILPLAAGAAVLLFLMKDASAKASPYSQAPADGSKPPVKEPPPPAKTWKEMPQALQEQVASALGALGVSPATGNVEGTPTADAVKLATQTAALCESQGFYDVAKELRRLIAQAAPKVPTPQDAEPIKNQAPPGLTPAQIEAIARTLTLDRDPKAIAALIETLAKLPPSPQRDHFIEMAQALLLQLAAAQSTTQTMQQIDEVIKSPGIAEVNAAVQPLPPVVVPVASPTSSPTLPPTEPPAALPAPEAPAPSVYAGNTGTRILRAGVKGEDVKAWQRILRADGFDVKVDGDFGTKTKAATRQWQAQRGLTADGEVGPKTRAKIGSVPIQDRAVPANTAAAQNATVPSKTLPTPTAPAPAALTLDKFPDPSPNARTLAKGSKGDDVRSWQRILKAFGYDMGKGGPAKDGVDGDFGPTTDKQTRAFQSWGFTRYKDPRIQINGKVDAVTRRLVLMRTAEGKAIVSGRRAA